MEIYIDGDACPVKDEVFRVAGRHGLKTYLVSNQWLRGATSPLIERVVVAEGADAADDWIATHTREGDICITADIPLASRCIDQGAAVLGPNGKPFTEAGIGMALATRDLMADLRDRGEVSSSAPAFTRQDRSRFLQALEQMIQAQKRRAAAG